MNSKTFLLVFGFLIFLMASPKLKAHGKHLSETDAVYKAQKVLYFYAFKKKIPESWKDVKSPKEGGLQPRKGQIAWRVIFHNPKIKDKKKRDIRFLISQHNGDVLAVGYRK